MSFNIRPGGGGGPIAPMGSNGTGFSLGGLHGNQLIAIAILAMNLFGRKK